MPEYLPLSAFRQGLLPGDCHSCAWWLTAGATVHRGPEAAGRRRDWMTGLEHEWGCVGLLAHELPGRRSTGDPADTTVVASIHFAPVSSIPRLRELPFPPLPPLSALLFCLRTDEDVARWTTKRLVRKAIFELKRRGVSEIYAVAHQPGNGNAADCRFFTAELLADNGFVEVAGDGRFSLMRVDNRDLVSLLDQVETAVRRIFVQDQEPAPSHAAWAEEGNEAQQGVR
jgi:hypothetical protein